MADRERRPPAEVMEALEAFLVALPPECRESFFGMAVDDDHRRAAARERQRRRRERVRMGRRCISVEVDADLLAKAARRGVVTDVRDEGQVSFELGMLLEAVLDDPVSEKFCITRDVLDSGCARIGTDRLNDEET